MVFGFGRSSKEVLMVLLSVFLTVSLGFSAAAEARVYDAFAGPGIDAGKWMVSDPLTFFSRPGDGQLHFGSDNTARISPAPGGILTSTASFGSGFFSMDFNHFSPSNISPGGQGLGSFAALWYVFADATAGRLGLQYDGSSVSFFYDDGVNGWKKLDTSGPDTHGTISRPSRPGGVHRRRCS